MKRNIIFLVGIVLYSGCVQFRASRLATAKRLSAELPGVADCTSVMVNLETVHETYSWKLSMRNQGDRVRYTRFLVKLSETPFVYRRRIRPEADQAFAAEENCVIKINRKDGREVTLYVIGRNLLIDATYRAFETEDDLFRSIFEMTQGKSNSVR
jgi:hypothetical protein